jgi:hypothetical protein
MFDFFTQRSASVKQTIFFVPQPDPFENPLVETSPSALRQWATALPFANAEQLSEAVLSSIGRLNRFPGQVRKRDELMAIYLSPAQRLSHTCASRSKGTPPLPLIRRVMLEMAYGYSHIANECVSSKANRKNLDRLAHALYFSIRFYLLEYLYACEAFDCRAAHSYREMSRLRTYAEEQSVQRREIEDMDINGPEKSTIEHLFNRFMLLRLLDPCHLQEGEPRICFDYLNSVASYAELVKPSLESARSGHYVIDRLGEVPPYPIEPEGLDNLSLPRFALFNLNPVSQRIHMLLRSLERSEEQKPHPMLNLSQQETANLLARMLKSWHIRPKRDSERHSTSGQVQVWSGLHSIHSYITRQSVEMPSEGDEITMTESALQSAQQDSSKPQLVARRFNQSRSGVALHLPPTPATRPHIGELVLISLHGARDTNDWKIGIVKRALARENAVLELGIQFLPGRIVPITLQAIETHTTEEATEEIPSHPALYIDQGHTHRSSLIVPKRLFVIGREYRVEEMLPAPCITPLQLLESTGMFERFRVKSC